MEFRELIKSLKGDHTVILSSHILSEIEQSCERVVIIDEGKVKAMDSVENLLSSYQGGERIRMQIEGTQEKVKKALEKIKTIKKLNITKAKQGMVNALVESENDIRRELAKAVVENDLGLLELSGERFTLEEVFKKLTTKEENA